MLHILMLTTRIPYFPSHGHFERTYNLIKYLHTYCNFWIIGFNPPEILKTNHAPLDHFTQEIISFSQSKPSLFVKYFHSCLKNNPFVLEKYFDKKIIFYLNKYARFCHILHFDILHMCQYVNCLTVGYKPILVTEHNVETLRIKRLWKLEKNPFKKRILAREIMLLKKYEVNLLNKTSAIIAVSDYDKKFLEKMGVKRPIFVVPNAVDTQKIPYLRPSQNKNLLWFGSLLDPYNKDAVFFFLEKIWPLIKKEDPEVKFTVVGRGSRKFLRRFAKDDPSLILRDFVPNLRQIVEEARIFVAPIRAGSGTKLKILTAMAYGLPVVTTPIGAEGIHGENRRHFIVNNDIELFAQNVLSLLQDYNYCQYISKNARYLIQRRYSWQEVSKKQLHIYQKFGTAFRALMGT